MKPLLWAVGLAAFFVVGVGEVLGHPHHPLEDIRHSLPTDPCVETWDDCLDPKRRTQIWIQAAFPKKHWTAAEHIVRGESRFRPLVCNGGGLKGSSSCPPARNYQAHGGVATGLWQHRWHYWHDYRAAAAAEWWGAPGTVLDIWNGWHSTLVARWLIETNGTGRSNWTGWAHFDTCRESGQTASHAIWCG